ncbi:hypothetical protein [Nodosilinea sp. LEGE 07298]|uniref:hypothetical protein n=1 Tax=Nodosilinea sp. LEGE 07298 TaxID=2777970 RepID=UPI0028BE5F9D|nr:hypothetical protein [Nodosilinea sp. LEGE 07298]
MKHIARKLTVFSALIATSLFGIGLGSMAAAQAQGLKHFSAVIAQSSNPVTYMTVIDRNTVVIQISEGGEFFFHGYLERTSGSTFTGEDDQVRVIYDENTKQLVVINRVTGDEFYNYYFSNVDEGAL